MVVRASATDSRPTLRLATAHRVNGLRQRAASTFLELVHAGSPSSPECIVELEDAHGARMKIHLKGAEVTDLAAVTELFWSRA